MGSDAIKPVAAQTVFERGLASACGDGILKVAEIETLRQSLVAQWEEFGMRYVADVFKNAVLKPDDLAAAARAKAKGTVDIAVALLDTPERREFLSNLQPNDLFLLIREATTMRGGILAALPFDVERKGAEIGLLYMDGLLKVVTDAAQGELRRRLTALPGPGRSVRPEFEIDLKRMAPKGVQLPAPTQLTPVLPSSKPAPPGRSI